MVKRYIGILLLLIFVFPEPGFCQIEKLKIVSVKVEGTDPIRVNIIKLASQLIEGNEVSGEDVQRSIKRLWSLGIFSHVQIEVESETSEGVNLLIKIKEYPKLDRLDVTGNKEIKRKDLDDKINLYRPMHISPLKIKNTIKRIKDLYTEKTFLLAEIDVEKEYSADTSRISLNFKINEGERVQVKKINFYGNNNFPESILKKQFSEIKEDKWWRGADFKQDKFEEDTEKLLAFYRKNGYRDAYISSDSLRYTEDKSGLLIDITVNEGLKYYFGKVEFNNNEAFTDEEIMRQFDFQLGDQYDEEKYLISLQKINKLYSDKGYIFVNINPREMPVAKDTVNIGFYFVEGDRVKINEVTITGNTKTKEYVIRREITTKPGDMFSAVELERSQREVTMLNYFAKVEPVPKMIPGNMKEINIEYVVEEKSTDVANMSAGVSQRDGLIGALGVTMSNFLGRGQRFNIDWQFGKYYRSFQIGFTEPWLMGTPTLAGFSIFDTKRGAAYYGFDWRTRGVSFRIGRKFKWPDDFFRADWIIQVTENEVSNIQGDLGSLASFYGITSNSIGITQIITRDSRDNPEFPTNGTLLSISTQFSGGILGGSEDYHKHNIQLTRYIPLIKSFVLYNDAQFGYIDGFREDSYIPPLNHYYMGGTAFTIGTPLRGYDDRTVGPTTEQGYAYGARTLSKFTTEIRFPVIQNPTVFGLFFGEAGNTWEDFRHTNPFDLRRSAGVGFRVFMPMMGLLGVDLGYGFDHIDFKTKEKKGMWKFHFQFGKYF